MSAGSPRRFPHAGHLAILERFFGDPQVRAELDKPRKIDNAYDIPDLCGYSTDGSTLFVDRHLAKAKPEIDGLSYDQWIKALVGPRGHEPTEWVAMEVWGYKYPAAHEDLATPSEHIIVTELGGRPATYEKQLKPWIKRTEVEKITKPPLNLDCRPLYTDPDANDLRVLKRLSALNVTDAKHHEFDPRSIGGRMAPDGKHYVPDPRQPGKYLRVDHG